MSGPNERLDYQIPRTPGERRTGRNFGLGLLAGVAASGAGWGIAYAAQRTDVTLGVLIALLVGKVGFAISAAASGKYRGFAPGLLVSFGVALLVAGGLCFAALKNI